MKNRKTDTDKIKLFDENRRQDIINTYLNKDYKKALRDINFYIEEYPLDELAVSIKASTLRCLGRYDEALSCLEACVNAEEKQLRSYVREKMYIYLCLERYEEAYELVNMLLYEYLFENSIDKELKKIIISVEKILLPEEEFNARYNYEDYHNQYIEKQIIKYDPLKAIDVAKTREGNNNAGWKFSENFDIDTKFYEVTNRLKHCVRIPSTILDNYFVYEPNCGIYENEKCDYLKVTTVKNTYDIVNIFPYPKDKVIFKKQEEDYTKTENGVKKKDMIKRFNDRYRKKD